MVYSYLTKEARSYYQVKTVSSINGVGKTGVVLAKIKLDYQFIPYTRINSKWIKDLNITNDIIQPPEEKTAVKFQISFVGIFLPMYLLGQQRKK